MEKLDLWVRIAQIVATGIAAWVAIWVGRNWLRTLRNQRIEECLRSVYEVHGLIDRCVALSSPKYPERWRCYDEAWDGWRRLNCVWAVVYRNHPGQVTEHYPDMLADVLFEVKELISAPDDRAAEEIKQKALAWRYRAEEMLPPIERPRVWGLVYFPAQN